jgi:hypothetical protein
MITATATLDKIVDLLARCRKYCFTAGGGILFKSPPIKKGIAPPEPGQALLFHPFMTVPIRSEPQANCRSASRASTFLFSTTKTRRFYDMKSVSYGFYVVIFCINGDSN